MADESPEVYLYVDEQNEQIKLNVPINMGLSRILQVDDPVDDYDAVNKNYVDSLVSGDSLWASSGSNIYYSSGKVAIGANTFGNSETQLRVYKSGNAELNVEGTNASWIRLTASSASQNWYMTAYPNDNTLRIGSYVGDVNLVLKGGNVGVNNVAPAEKLHITGNILLDNNYTINWKKSSGSSVPVFGVFGADQLNIYNPSSVINFVKANATDISIQVFDTVWRQYIPTDIRSSQTNDLSNSYIALSRQGSAAGATGPTLSGAEVGYISFNSYDGISAYRQTASIKGLAVGNTTTTSSGGELIFYTVPSSTTTAIARLKISHDGKVGLGGATSTTFSQSVQILGGNALILSGTDDEDYQAISICKNDTLDSNNIMWYLRHASNNKDLFVASFNGSGSGTTNNWMKFDFVNSRIQLMDETFSLTTSGYIYGGTTAYALLSTASGAAIGYDDSSWSIAPDEIRGTANNILSVKAVSDGTFHIMKSMMIEEIADTPSNPTQSNQSRIYLKGDKLIIQFNDGGTVRYKYLDLTGTGVTWTHTTSAP